MRRAFSKWRAAPRVQHRDGRGVFSDIYVREGQRVTRGQLLIRLAAAEVLAQGTRIGRAVDPLLAHARGSRRELANRG